MKTAALLSALIPSALGATLYLAGDSTMAAGGGGQGTNGWGEYVTPYTTLTVSNHAHAGRSARSYTREGRFAGIAGAIQPGDWVVIEFGHNDGGSLSVSDDGRPDCPGTGNQTCRTVYDGENETVLMFPAYLENAAKTFKARGANVLISSQTPNNPWQSGSFAYHPTQFVGDAKLAAQRVNVAYVDHGAYVASIYGSLGAEVVDAYFPNDHTHTSPEGARVVAEAFFKAVICDGFALQKTFNTTRFPGKCL
ncbi:hypothetical protein BDV24DRAFT_162169 [Aspergillus arachidicola]|uniref:Uncharacterized protein n=1 Tax=Aspergillus arachidicola TaxID=656916 RepID=A0A5N6YBR5_9EURO|nr:hypothetical protein BDV24DRAFT_162169 [Aspergillus arachidicola]